jgi:hypothetical protein
MSRKKQLVVDEQNSQTARSAKLCVRAHLAEEVHDIEHIDRIAANLGHADYIVRRAGDLNVERLFDDVDDFVDKQAHGILAMEIMRMGCVAFVNTTSGEVASTGTRLP